jgi:mono/diheme cytochrome c family protein
MARLVQAADATTVPTVRASERSHPPGGRGATQIEDSNMRDLRSVIVAAAGVALLAGLAWGQAAAPAAPDAKPKDGKTLFADNHCTSCHSIAAVGIEKKKPAAGVEEEKTDKKPPDLSDVGAKQKPAWMVKFLTKQVKLDDELHPKKFRGTDADLTTLTTWLGTLTKKAADKK